jgi:hypothetical protein
MALGRPQILSDVNARHAYAVGSDLVRSGTHDDMTLEAEVEHRCRSTSAPRGHPQY